jgi:hypothetical protein
MKETEILSTDKVEIHNQAEVSKQVQFSFRQILKRGHKIWQINEKTLEVTEASIKSTVIVNTAKVADKKFPKHLHELAADMWHGKNCDSYTKDEIMIKEGFVFVPSLNKKTALRNYLRSLERISKMYK